MKKIKIKNTKVPLSWMVHLYTALGGVLGFFALVLASQGNINYAFTLLLLSVIIDSSDGMMARKVEVSKHVPNFDGAMLDNVVDIFTYAYVPFFIIWKLDILNHPFLLSLPLLGALYAYGQKNMKTEDNYFLGFPTYWNIVALYFYLLPPTSIVASIILLVLSILCFIPTRYLYPSKSPTYRKLFGYSGMVWFISLLICLYNPTQYHFLSVITLLYPTTYMTLSFYSEVKIRSKAKVNLE